MKKLLATLLSLIIVLGCFPFVSFAEFEEQQEQQEIQQEEQQEEQKEILPEFTYYEDNGEVVLTGAKCEETEVCEIPKTIDEFPVCRIEDGAFKDCFAQKIIIHETVYEISAGAFNSASATEIEVTGENESYSSLDGVLYNKNKTVLIRCPENKTGELTLPETVLVIGEKAFCNCKITSVKLNEALSSICDKAFYNSAVTSVYIPFCVQSIGEYALGYMYSEEQDFVKNEEFEIWGEKNTPAETYALENGFKFVNTNPDAPELTEAVADNECITFYWEETDGADSYNIYRKTNGGVWQKIEEHYTDDTVYCDYNIKTGNVYEYSVSACIGDFEGGFERDGVSAEYIKLPTPVLVSCEMNVNSITVTWKKVASCEGYILYRRTQDTDWEEIGEFSASAVKYTDKDLESDNTYYYTVKCFRNELISNYDTAGISTYFLAVPLSLNATSAKKGITVKWEKVKGADRYIIGRKTSDGGYTKLAETGDVSSYTDKTAKTGVTYTYTVVSCKGAFKGLYNETGVSGIYLPAPEVTVSNGTSGVNLSWTKSSGASGYIIYRKTANGSYEKLTTVKGVSVLSYTDKTAENGVKYTYNVKAYYSKYKSIYKNDDGVTDIYLKTPKISSAVSSKSGITLKWSKNSSADKYYIYRKTTGGFSRLATVKGASAVTYLDKTAKKGVKYTYTVKAVKGSYMSGYYSSNSKAVCTDKY